MERQSFVWRKLEDRSEFPPGLADLIHSAHVLVYAGAEYAGIFIHSEGRCWIGWRSIEGESRSQICSDPDDAKKRVETMMRAGLIQPRRRSRF